MEIEIRQYKYLDRPLMTTSTPEHMANKWYSKLLFVKMRPIRKITVWLTVVTTYEDNIHNTISVDRATVALGAKKRPTEYNMARTDETVARRKHESRRHAKGRRECH